MHRFTQLRTTRHRHARARGFTLIEVLIVLALTALAAFFVFGRGNEAQVRADAQAERDFFQSILPSLRQTKTGASYAGLSATVLINSGLIDKGRVSGTTIINTGGSAITFAAANFNGGTDNAYQITNPGLTRNVCADLSGSLSQISNIQTLAINGTTVLDRVNNVQATAATIGTACTDQNNSLVLVGT